MFKYIFIPTNDSKPIELRSGDKSGGLQNDIVSQTAKDYFFSNSDKGAKAAALKDATPEQRTVLAKQLREEIQTASATSSYASQMAALDDDTLINIMMTTNTSASCEITALTVPTKSNNQRAVSMYSADDARTQELPYNRRATELLVACGHNITSEPSPNTVSIGAAPPGGICGDAYVARCHDDEMADVWERVDFTIEDANPRADWCSVARQPGGGGGGAMSAGGAGGRSLSGVMNQQQMIASGGGNNNAAPGGSFHEGKAEGYTWSQNEDEVEFRFPVSSGTKAKYVKVTFGMTKLKVVVAGQTLLNGTLGGKAVVDDSTFTIEDASSGSGKELCVTLGKKEGNTWPFVIESKPPTVTVV